ncbi:MAG: helix-hairpin-helix domain-containing protein [Candidatus Thorarchaeota archaeon]
MRYALGILYGAIITGIIFLGSAAIKFAGNGVTDQAELDALWGVFQIWTFVSILIIIAPVIIVFFLKRDTFKEFLLFEVGGLALFTPMWLLFATELTGRSIVELFTTGIESGLIWFGPDGSLIGGHITPILFIPLMGLMILMGIIILRPSFLAKHAGPSEPGALKALKDDISLPAEKGAGPPSVGPPPGAEPIESEMPGVTPPIASAASEDELRSLLTELGTPDTTISAILNAGIATVTDLVATSPDQLVSATGIDKKSAEDLHMLVQKKVWFGGI